MFHFSLKTNDLRVTQLDSNHTIPPLWQIPREVVEILYFAQTMITKGITQISFVFLGKILKDASMNIKNKVLWGLRLLL